MRVLDRMINKMGKEKEEILRSATFGGGFRIIEKMCGSRSHGIVVPIDLY